MRDCSKIRMMNVLFVLCLLLELDLFHAASVSSNPTKFYDVITKYCHFDKPQEISQTFRDQDVFKHCVNWEEISQTTSLTRENENNVLCLLYFESFVSFCKEFPKVNIRKATTTDLVPEPKVLNYTVDVICKNLSLIPAGKDYHISKIVNRDSLCIKLCTDYSTREPVRECSLAYFYATYNISQLKVKVEAKQGVGRSILSPGDSASVANSVVAGRPILQSPQDKILSAERQLPVHQPPADTSKANNAPSDGKNSIVGDNIERGDSEHPKQAVIEEKTVGSSKVQTTEATTTPHQSTLEAQIKENIKGPKITQENQNGPHAAQGGTGSGKEISNPTQVKTQESQAKVNQASGIDNPLDQRPEEPEAPGESFVDDTIGDVDDSPENPSNDNPVVPANEITPVPVKKPAERNNKPSTRAHEMTSIYNTADVDEESYFFSYFMVICVLFILGYVGYHNRQKVMALVLEGKRGKRQYRSRRPNSANYHKLDSNLEEAISSTCTKNTSHVIY